MLNLRPLFTFRSGSGSLLGSQDRAQFPRSSFGPLGFVASIKALWNNVGAMLQSRRAESELLQVRSRAHLVSVLLPLWPKPPALLGTSEPRPLGRYDRQRFIEIRDSIAALVGLMKY